MRVWGVAGSLVLQAGLRLCGAEDGPEPLILLPRPAACRDYRPEPSEISVCFNSHQHGAQRGSRSPFAGTSEKSDGADG